MTDKTADELRADCKALLADCGRKMDRDNSVYRVASYALQRLDAPGPRLTILECAEWASIFPHAQPGGLMQVSSAEWNFVYGIVDKYLIDRLSAQPKETGKVCGYCHGKGYIPGDPEGAAIEDCQPCASTGIAPEKAEGEAP